MGWFWGTPDSSPKDSTSNLDPSLRSFLSSASPSKYRSSTSAASEPQYKYTAQLGLTDQPDPFEPRPATTTDAHGNHPTVADQTQFPDGRYAHLWRTYRPLDEIENETKTEQERLQDVIEGYKERKSQISRAALENCAEEQMDVNECFRSGSWSARFTMCRAENRKFSSCYTMQAKFLKALGYLSIFDRPSHIDEAIQMHADTLYHRLLDQEAAIASARSQGLPTPSFPPLLPAPGTVSHDSPIRTVDALNATTAKGIDQLRDPTMRARAKERLEGMKPRERELEERAIMAEIAAGQQLGGDVGMWYQRRERLIEERKERGQSTFGDWITKIFRFE
ncbi:MAG: hypothetical protein M1833_005989 [Piccolia ochrophora]|nr:MAG: hypothetical protein M1833_005989 [Piccolia ochrophora]